jgi:hypothetical protein
MTTFLIPILILDTLLLIWIMGRIPRHLFFPNLNIAVLLLVPFIFSMLIFYDLKASFGLFDTSVVPLFQHMELYLLFSLVFLGFYSIIGLAVTYYYNRPRDNFYYRGIRNTISSWNWTAVIFNIVMILFSILGVLRFYFAHDVFR